MTGATVAALDYLVNIIPHHNRMSRGGLGRDSNAAARQSAYYDSEVVVGSGEALQIRPCNDKIGFFDSLERRALSA